MSPPVSNTATSTLQANEPTNLTLQQGYEKLLNRACSDPDETRLLGKVRTKLAFVKDLTEPSIFQEITPSSFDGDDSKSRINIYYQRILCEVDPEDNDTLSAVLDFSYHLGLKTDPSEADSRAKHFAIIGRKPDVGVAFRIGCKDDTTTLAAMDTHFELDLGFSGADVIRKGIHELDASQASDSRVEFDQPLARHFSDIKISGASITFDQLYPVGALAGKTLDPGDMVAGLYNTGEVTVRVMTTFCKGDKAYDVVGDDPRLD